MTRKTRPITPGMIARFDQMEIHESTGELIREARATRTEAQQVYIELAQQYRGERLMQAFAGWLDAQQFCGGHALMLLTVALADHLAAS